MKRITHVSAHLKPVCHSQSRFFQLRLLASERYARMLPQLPQRSASFVRNQ